MRDRTLIAINVGCAIVFMGVVAYLQESQFTLHPEDVPSFVLTVFMTICGLILFVTGAPD